MTSERIAFTVNGVRRIASAGASATLLSYLRNELGLTGAKNGCDGTGTCGACTVLVDGAARKSCQLALPDAAGCEIVTIEGLVSPSGDLHPIQRAFIDAGAVQCGFCTPGMILATKALLDRNARPSRDDIVQALSGNLCRCTGYAKIVDAAERAADALAGSDSGADGVDAGSARASGIGGSRPRPDAAGKVTGRTRFADDARQDDDLVLRVVWSAEAHAHILGVRLDAAKAMPGVVDVLTAADVPGRNAYGLIHRNQPVLCEEVVRFDGDPIALVIAESEADAIAAAERVVVELDPLPAVFDTDEALADDAPRVHPDGNLACEYGLAYGDAEDQLERASTVVSGRFETTAVEHAYLEPEAGYAEWDDGCVVVHAAAQYPQTVRDQLADVLGIEPERVRLISPAVGGAFGGKTDISVHALLALAAWRTRRRVRLTWTREESLRASVKRHPMRMDYRIGLSDRGEIVGVTADIVANAGAYESLSLPLLEQTAAFSAGPYRVPAVDVRVRGIYTNTPTSSALRGFGIPQPTFAVESLLDEAARKLGLSPIELRRRNALRAGDRSATGQIMRADTHLAEALDALEPIYERLAPSLGRDEGLGVACGYKNIGLGLGENDHATATVRACPDGTLVVSVGAVDVGQGSEAVIGQLAAHRLGVPADRVVVRWGDTADTPDGRETNASRQTVVSGNAALAAADRLMEDLVRRGPVLCPELEAPFRYERGLVDAGGRRVEWGEICVRLSEPVEATARYTAPDTAPLSSWTEDGEAPTNYFAYTFFANLAYVAVDRATGRTTVRRIASAYDIGRVIHRQAAEGQIEGGAAMGLGFALSESFVAHGDGRTTTLAGCGVPRSTAVPPIETRFVEAADSVGPHGCKGLGEVAMIAVAPSITNAIRDAVGVRVRSLPATAKRLRVLLNEQVGEGGR